MKKLKILVTAKRVTDPDMKITVLPDGSGIELSGMNFKVNPFDEIAIEEALRIKEKKGGEVVVVSVGGEKAQTEIRVGLAMGADRGILVTPEGDVDSDTVARVLAAVIQLEKPDLVLMGKQSVDLDDNQVAQLVSEYLGWGQACFASQIEILDGTVRVHREVDGGIEVLEIDLPGIISADLRLNEPRYPKLPDILKAKKKEIRTIAASELGINMSPKVVVTKLEQPSQRQAGRFVEDVVELVKALKEEAKVL
jgi:electron transfer flavoprotein beta subunit